MLDQFEAHLKAGNFYSVVANMRGSSLEEVAQELLDTPGRNGLSRPIIQPRVDC